MIFQEDEILVGAMESFENPDSKWILPTRRGVRDKLQVFILAALTRLICCDGLNKSEVRREISRLLDSMLEEPTSPAKERLERSGVRLKRAGFGLPVHSSAELREVYLGMIEDEFHDSICVFLYPETSSLSPGGREIPAHIFAVVPKELAFKALVLEHIDI